MPAGNPLSAALAPPSRAVPVSPALLGVSLPAAILAAGERAALHSLEFFAARTPNPHTRAAYGRAVADFCHWCDARQLPLPALSSPLIALYYQQLTERLSPASANLHLTAVRQWLDWLTRSGVLPANPAAPVRALRLSRHEGKTPVLHREQARRLFASLDGSRELSALRDRAILAVMLYGFVRVGAVVAMRVRDVQEQEGAAELVLHEKGGKERRIPAHHLVREYLRAYVRAAGLDSPAAAKQPLFQSVHRHGKAPSGKPLTRSAVLGIVKRRCRAIGLPPTICNHSFRATGITLHQQNGGDLASAARLAGHADVRTTQLYDRSSRNLSIEVERVQL